MLRLETDPGRETQEQTAITQDSLWSFPPGVPMGQLQSPKLPWVSRAAPSQNEGQSGQAGTFKGRCQGYRAGSKPSTPACRVQAKPRTPWRAMLLSTLVFPRAEDFSR